MKKSKKQPEPFLLVFPWAKVSMGVLGMLFFGMFVYRLSAMAGLESSRACLMAIVISGVGGGLGLYIIGKTWRRDISFMLAGAMIAMAIRMLIGGGGVAIITRFTDVHRSWFVLYLGVYYLAFLAVDTWLALWILRNSELEKREKMIHGNLWDIVG
jgi:hypothetical protein